MIKQRRENSRESKDLLGKILEAVDEETGESLTDEQLVDEGMVILLAGHGKEHEQ